jgi:hypothetical protein
MIFRKVSEVLHSLGTNLPAKCAYLITVVLMYSCLFGSTCSRMLGNRFNDAARMQAAKPPMCVSHGTAFLNQRMTTEDTTVAD